MTTETQAPDPAPVLRQYTTVFVVNKNDTNRWWATVMPGHDDDGRRVSDAECKAVAKRIHAAMNAIPAPEGAQAQWNDDRMVELKMLRQRVAMQRYELARLKGPNGKGAPAPQAPAEIEAKADNDSAYAYADGWNACRRAMLAAAPAPTDAELERRTGEPHVDGWPLVSGLPVPQAPAWQPIETAPEGTMILCANMKAREARDWCFVAWMVKGKVCGHRMDMPTHWMPLPAAPQTKEPTNDR